MSEVPQRPQGASPGPDARAAHPPPAERSRAALGLAAAAALGRLELQVCSECGAVQYPPREACHRCLCGELKWQPQSGQGELICETTLHHSYEPYFRDRLPWRIGMVRLDCGPTVITHVRAGVSCAPCRVRIVARLDQAGQAALIALPERETGDGAADMAGDPRLQELTREPDHGAPQ
ncbi:MAG TPA: OB-fold domain-containing protein [Steroidobacteraceae bacterium]